MSFDSIAIRYRFEITRGFKLIAPTRIVPTKGKHQGAIIILDFSLATLSLINSKSTGPNALTELHQKLQKNNRIIVCKNKILFSLEKQKLMPWASIGGLTKGRHVTPLKNIKPSKNCFCS